MKVYIYMRSNRKENLKEQREICESFAAKQNWTVSGAFDDYDKIRELIDKGEVDKLLIAHRSRLTRNALDYLTAVFMLRDKGVDLISVHEADLKNDFRSLKDLLNTPIKRPITKKSK